MAASIRTLGHFGASIRGSNLARGMGVSGKRQKTLFVVLLSEPLLIALGLPRGMGFAFFIKPAEDS